MIPEKIFDQVIRFGKANEDHRGIVVGYEELAMAIVAQAAKDRCRSFFFSEWFIFLTSGRISGPALWKGVQHNFKTLGRWSVTNEIAGSYRHEPVDTAESRYRRKKRRENNEY